MVSLPLSVQTPLAEMSGVLDSLYAHFERDATRNKA